MHDAVGARSRHLRIAFATIALALGLAARELAAADAPRDCPPAAEPPSAEAVQTGMANARDHGFLWRIRKDGRTSYLYGTIHLGKLEWAFPGPSVAAAIAATDAMELEIDVADPIVMEEMRTGMMPKPDRKLSSAVDAHLRAELDAACLPRALLETMAPELVGVSLVTLSARRRGLDPAYAVDAVLAGMGHALGKEVSSLETVDSQLALLLGRDAAEGEKLVEQSLGELESGKAVALLTRLAGIWSEGRLEELEHYADWCGCVETDFERALMKRMLDERNPVLADGIDAAHSAGKRAFAAVGSLHMIGKAGLPALMTARGYAVERVRFAH